LPRKLFKLAVNAGASGAESLAESVKENILEKRYELEVLWMEVDVATGAAKDISKEIRRV
jgi:hypothetical protein